MPLKRRQIENLLKTKFGFEEADHRSDDHNWYVLQLEGLPAIFTKFSHSENEIGKNLEGKIARQLRVSKPFFSGMFKCDNDKDAYYDQVRDDPTPPWDVRF